MIGGSVFTDVSTGASVGTSSVIGVSICVCVGKRLPLEILANSSRDPIVQKRLSLKKKTEPKCCRTINNRIAASLSGNAAFLSGNAAFLSGDAAFLSGAAAFRSGGAALLSGNAASPSGDAAFLSGNAAFPSGDAAFLRSINGV